MFPRILFIPSCGLLLLAYGCTASDYCEEAKHPLSDAELISKVVSSESSYPNCCRVHRGDDIEIEIYEKVSDADEQKRKYPEYAFYEQHLTVNACGKILESHGMHVKDKDRPCWARKEKVSKLTNEELVRAALAKAAKEMNLGESAQSIDQFMRDHPTCCRVQRLVKDETYPQWLNPAQVEVYYATQKGKANGAEDFFRILVAFNACADWSHMYGPSRIDKSLVPALVK